MKLPKFGEWLSFKEATMQGMNPAPVAPRPKNGKPNPKYKKLVASAAKSGNPDSAIDDVANDPGATPTDVAQVANAVNILKGGS